MPPRTDRRKVPIRGRNPYEEGTEKRKTDRQTEHTHTHTHTHGFRVRTHTHTGVTGFRVQNTHLVRGKHASNGVEVWVLHSLI
jgi:hypothetical protein